MKKIIAALTLFLAFSINATAQDKTTTMSPQEKGKRQAEELAKLTNINADLTRGFTALFTEKFTVVDDPKSTPEKKARMASIVEGKIRASLDEKQMDKLEKTPELLKRLIN